MTDRRLVASAGPVMAQLLRREARVAIEPSGTSLAARGDDVASRRRLEHFRAIVEGAGGTVVPVAQANALVWLAIGDPAPLVALLDANPQITWVQLPWAGVETFAESGVFARQMTFTCAKASFGGQVGEHALTLILVGLRHVTMQARTREWHQTEPDSLEGKRVTILGAGGTAASLIRFLNAADCDVTVVRRGTNHMPGATRTLPVSELRAVLPETEILVLALALTPATRQIVGAAELALLPSSAILVNVARGSHVNTSALVDALNDGQLAAACLDVTDPEPLPPEHPLWSMDNVLITSHCADSIAYVTEKLGERVQHNVVRFQNGEPLAGAIDPIAGY